MKKTLLPVIGDVGENKLCPSFSPMAPGRGWVFGIVMPQDDGHHMVPLEEPEPVTQEIFDLAAPLDPSEVFRMTTPCLEGSCKNFGEGGICHLAKSAASLSDDSADLPVCNIRPKCLWWHQEGPKACKRCSVVVTNNARSLEIRKQLMREQAETPREQPET